MTGDEAHMPAQHRGPERRLVRDVVDSRHNLGEYFVIGAAVVLLLGFLLPRLLPNAYMAASIGILVVVWGGLILCVIDAFVLRRSLRAALTERFGHVGSGYVSYGIMRALQVRRWRLPKPQVRHGEAPRR